MNRDLDRLAETYGIALSFISETGEERYPSDDAKRKLLAAMGIAAATDDEVQQSLAALERPRCYIPGWLEEGRAWGITCQLYGLRSQRNWGIGDFEDLARLAELAASAGADFVGINPLHSLFLSEPQRFSPYAPSSRRFLNPFYIAVDKLGAQQPDDEKLDALRNEDLVDYPAVANLKKQALELHFREFRAHHLGIGSESGLAFEQYRRHAGQALEEFSLFEALSEAMVAQNMSCGWHGWPDPYKDKDSRAVAEFRERNGNRILFHMWLQWVTQEQLAAAQARARSAGMRIGLYLDLAVGVAPDGAETWSEPESVLRGVRVGSPPDAFNSKGQDWGLAPLSPLALRSGQTRIFRDVISAGLQSAGAIRIDHVMALRRLYLIAEGIDSTDGAYVEYPLDGLLDMLGAASLDAHALVIGEDLGTVPPNFREIMRAAGILGYRVLFFERRQDGKFRLPEEYERDAMACISTHDLPTLAGWWGGHDLDDREAIGLDDAEGASIRRADRAAERKLMLEALAESNLLPQDFEAAAFEQTLPDELDETLITAISRFLARTPCRLVAVQLEDLAGMKERANLPGTTDEHPNWRRKLPVMLETIGDTSLFRSITQAVAEERPRSRDPD